MEKCVTFVEFHKSDTKLNDFSCSVVPTTTKVMAWFSGRPRVAQASQYIPHFIVDFMVSLDDGDLKPHDRAESVWAMLY